MIKINNLYDLAELGYNMYGNDTFQGVLDLIQKDQVFFNKETKDLWVLEGNGYDKIDIKVTDISCMIPIHSESELKKRGYIIDDQIAYITLHIMEDSPVYFDEVTKNIYADQCRIMCVGFTKPVV